MSFLCFHLFFAEKWWTTNLYQMDPQDPQNLQDHLDHLDQIQLLSTSQTSQVRFVADFNKV